MKQVVTFALVVTLAVLSFCAEACQTRDASASTCPTHQKSDCCDHQKSKADTDSVASVVFALPIVSECVIAATTVTVELDTHFDSFALFEFSDPPRTPILRL